MVNFNYILDDTGNPVAEPDILITVSTAMVFGGKLDQEQDRCSGNREQAEAMHARMLERVKAAENA